MICFVGRGFDVCYLPRDRGASAYFARVLGAFSEGFLRVAVFGPVFFFGVALFFVVAICFGATFGGAFLAGFLPPVLPNTGFFAAVLDFLADVFVRGLPASPDPVEAPAETAADVESVLGAAMAGATRTTRPTKAHCSFTPQCA